MEIETGMLLGKKVFDQTGKCLGRIEEIEAELRGDEYVVTNFIVGSQGLAERLLVGTALFPGLNGILDRLLRRGAPTHRIRWQDLDLSNPHRPVATAVINAN